MYLISRSKPGRQNWSGPVGRGDALWRGGCTGRGTGPWPRQHSISIRGNMNNRPRRCGPRSKNALPRERIYVHACYALPHLLHTRFIRLQLCSSSHVVYPRNSPTQNTRTVSFSILQRERHKWLEKEKKRELKVFEYNIEIYIYIFITRPVTPIST